MDARSITTGLCLSLTAAVACAQWSPSAALDLGLGKAQVGINPALLSPARPSVAATSTRVIAEPALRSKAYCARHRSDPACRRAALQPRPSPAAAPQSLDFKPTAGVSQKVDREVIDDLARRNRDQWRPKLEAELRIADLKGQFVRLLRLHGRSPTNVADVLGVYLAVYWESYAGETASPAQVVALARHWRRSLKASELATRSDAQKQALAETLAWRAMLASGVVRTARVQAAPQLFVLREGMRQEVQQATGIDFARVRLGTRGFE
ncbi:MAG: hypothetical protein OEU94_16415 [Aquincola sp.]|nr:hypothetical protein [Aquincola sp.]MDH4290176.1 hypothetical protein [Aquincola sp.]MDH5331671.1 hypothetical protein [Aquincola sp.]